MRKASVAGLILAMGWCMTLQADGLEGAKEGLYEISMATQMPGMPMDMGPQTIQQCMKKDDFKDPQRLLQEEGAVEECQVTDQKMGSQNLTFSLNCPAEHMTGKGDYTFSATGYSGVVVMTVQGMEGGGPTTMTTKIQARYMGPCN
ncbi:MAG: DUF3617 family protein [Magnetococcales bacterium]|nr:DUF3617 family protein [Magnetococcales bacterium]